MPEVRRLKQLEQLEQLEQENARLKKLLAARDLEVEVMVDSTPFCMARVNRCSLGAA